MTRSYEREGKVVLNTQIRLVFHIFGMVNSFILRSARKGANLGKNIVIISTESTTLFINVPGNGLPYLADDVVN